MADGRARLRARLAEELEAPVVGSARTLARAVRARHGAAVAAVVFYGSCRRRRTSEGLHDLYAVVDDYRTAYRSRALARANAWLPPNVFPLETPGPGQRWRAKVAIVSWSDLRAGCGRSARRCALWARMVQPLAAVYLRDAAAREALVEARCDAVLSAVAAGLALGGGGATRDPGRFWSDLFAATYACEWRPERPEMVRALYEEDPSRYDVLLAAGIEALVEGGELLLDADGRPVGGHRAHGRSLRPARGKALTALQLLKSAFTFGDWLPYALEKLERHSGVRLETSARERRHPLLFAAPLLLRAWRSGALR